MLNAVLKSYHFENKKFGKRLSPHQLFLEIINHMIEQQKLLFDLLSDGIKLVYREVKDLDVGQVGYSYKTYLEYMMKRKVWCLSGLQNNSYICRYFS